MKRALSLIVAVLFLAGGVASAQTQAPAAPKAEEKKAEKTEKKPAGKSATGSLKSAAADSVVVAGKDKGKDAEWTFVVDAKTKITKGGKSVTAADLKAGDPVVVRYMEEGGKAMAQSINVRAAATAKKAAEPKKEEKPAEKKP